MYYPEFDRVVKLAEAL